ncbi:MAG: FlgD immunoglobulin-like domain containing protein [Verrucomicrobiota bacterium]
MKTLCVAAVLLAVFPASARAGDHAAIRLQEAPIGATRTTAAAVAPGRFDLVGLHWEGSGTVLFRTRSLAGRWSRWQPAAPEDDGPTNGSAETRLRRQWRLGSPYWAGPSDMLAYRLVGPVRRLRIWYVQSAVSRSPLRTTAMTGSPRIVPRSGWHAEEEILRGRPRYAASAAFAVVHHTAGSNTYTRAQSAAIVLGIEVYHVRANGWNDIGYNFLVDKYGQVFEGRAGGIDRNVIGAHAQGFNTGSVGVALIGNYTAAKVAPAARHALVDLLAWRLDVAHVDPLGTLTWRSGGNPEFPRGRPVKLRAISGHRDTGYTSCPGTSLYVKLPDIARAVAATGLPKLYAPTVTGGLGGPVRFSARLSAAAAWVVTVRSASGAVVARGRGTGTAVAWTWDAGRIPVGGSYTWTIEAGPQTRPASGTIGRAPAPAPPPSALVLTGLTVAPPVVSPDGDGIDDALAISYTLGARASVTATVKDATGAVVATLFANQVQGARRQSFAYGGDGLADGAYTLSVAAVTADGRSGRLEAPFAIDRTLSGLALSTAVLTPNGDGVDDTIGISFTLATGAEVTVQIEQAGSVVAPVSSGPLPAGSSQIVWDGTTPAGPAAPGNYDAVVLVDGVYGLTRHAASFTVSG